MGYSSWGLKRWTRLSGRTTTKWFGIVNYPNNKQVSTDVSS